jgi:hypothetical protein
MKFTVRIVLAVLICLAAATLVVVGRRQRADRNEAAATADAAGDARDCRRCHEAVWREWEASYHALAFSHPDVQAAFQHFGNDRKCQSCHAPQPILAAGVEAPAELRLKGLESGVDCLSCHQMPDGRSVAARRTVADAPCRPVEHKDLGGSRFCGVCHESIYEDWHESRYAAEGRTCQDCHMPDEPGRSGGRSHLCLGGHDAATVRAGAEMACRREGEELVVAVTNHATGHNFPGERHHRIVQIQVIETDAAGQIVLARQVLIKGVTPFRGESSSDEIGVDSTFEARFPVVDPPVTADVRLLYKAFPWYTDQEALVVCREKLELE